jgi:hypothetical protein
MLSVAALKASSILLKIWKPSQNCRPKPEMQAQFLGVLEAVPSQLLAVIDALLTSVGFALDNKSKT